MKRRLQCIAAVILATVVGAATSCDGDDAPPDECDADPLDSASCGKALDARCRAQTTQEDCESQGPFTFNRNIEYACSWASRITFDDPAACFASEASHVCVAIGKDPEFECADGCSDTDFFNTLVASTSANELILHTCPADGASIFGPIDQTVLIADETFSYVPCTPATTPPRPDVCSCRAQACAAVDGT